MLRRNPCQASVGPVLSLGNHSPSLMSRLREAAAIPMTELDDQFDETVTLAIRTQRMVRFIAEVECSHQLRVGHRTGMAFPAELTSGGLVLLAALTDEEIFDLYHPDLVGSDEGAADLEMIMRRVQSAREQGFGLVSGLLDPGIVTVAHAVRGPQGVPLAAIGLAMPSSRFEANQLPVMVAGLRRAARAIEAETMADAPHPAQRSGSGRSALVV